MSELGQTNSETAELDIEQYRLVRPTLYIGVGGTGAAILTALRRRIMQTQWGKHRLESLDDFKVASFLYFDTYAGPAKDQEARRKENEPGDPLAPLVALPKADCIQAGLDTAKYLRQDSELGTAELNSYPHVKEWLPAEELSSINIEEGAGQIRAISRLLFFDRIAEIKAQIDSRVRALVSNLAQKDLLNEQNLKTTQKVNIKIVGSAAGGTGSGSFLDMGYLARSVRDPSKPEEVSLWMVLGGAFAGQGARVMANTYAALAELEYAMKLFPRDPDFIKSWDREGRLKPADGDKRPYDRIYLFDSMNMQHIGVNNDGRDYIFRMIADLLLQELAEPDLVAKRRGDLSNQDANYRAPLYVPTVTRQYEGQGLQYSRAFSGIGQSTVETRARIEHQAQSAEVASGMLKAYFRFEGTQSEAPKAAAVDDYLKEKLFLGPASQFVVHKDIRTQPVLSDYPLVFSNLLSWNGGSLLDSVRNDVSADFQKMMENPKLGEWPTLAAEITKKRRNEIEQESADRERMGLTIRTAAVENASRTLAAQLTAQEGPIRKSLLGLVDSEIGGIWYAGEFIATVKARLKAEWIPRFARDADTYGQLAQKVMAALYQQAADNLQSESKGGIMKTPNRQRMETIVNQMKDTLTTWMQYRLRQVACIKAVEILNAVDAALGDSLGAGADGKPSYTGVLRDIHDGEDTVLAAIEELNREASIIRDPDTARNPIHQVIGSSESVTGPVADCVVDQATYRQLAAIALKEYKGASNVFSDLKDRKKRAGIISRLRRVASEEAGPSGRPILMAEANVPSFYEDFKKSLSRQQQESVLKDAMKQAMPWVNIDRSLMGDTWDDKMLGVFVCVSDSETFKNSEFGAMMNRALADCGFANNEISYVDTQSQGRLQICAELSGLPLDTLIQLHHDWFRFYEQIRENSHQAPLHTHVTWEKFGRPTAPDAAQMRIRLDDIGLFIQGVGCGLLRRRSGNVPAGKEGLYEINMRAGLIANNWIPVGRELKIRNFGLKAEHKAELQKELQKLLTDLGPHQVMALLALFEFYSRYHYTPILVKDTWHSSLGHLASDTLMQTFRKRFGETTVGRKLIAADSDCIEKRAKALVEAIDEWTSEVPGSLDDVVDSQAIKREEDSVVLPKRVIRKDVFDNEALLCSLAEGKNRGAATAPASAPSVVAAEAAPPAAAPPAGPRYFWYVGPDGKVATRGADETDLARLANDGTITAETNICLKGTKEWRPAGAWLEFAHLFEAPPPAPVT